jgi:hypothetical protein
VKDIVERLQKKRLIFKSLKEIDIRELGSRKKINIYLGVDLKKYYTCIIYISKKSRILKKEAEQLVEIHKKLESYNNSKIKRKYIYIESPLCSKAKALLEDKGWIVFI